MISNPYLQEKLNLTFSDYTRQKEEIQEFVENKYMENQAFSDAKYEYNACVFALEKARFLGEEEKVFELEKKKKLLEENYKH